MTSVWRAWQDREVRIVSGRFEGSTGRILARSRNRTLIIGIRGGQPEGGRCIKVHKRVVEPIERSRSSSTEDRGHEISFL